MPDITVVITTCNLEKYIGRCLNELYHQTMQDFDILIVDDASTDGTRSVVERWKETFGERLQTIFLDNNLGMPALTRNVALESGKIDGDYVLFLDGDDSVEKDMLETLYSLVKSDDDIDIAVCAFERVDIDTGSVISVEMKGFPGLISLPPQNDSIAFINTSPWNKLWKRKIVKDLRYPMLRVGEEVAFNFLGYTKCRKMAFTNKVLIHYGVRQDSVIANTEEEDIWAFADEMFRLYEEQTNSVYRDLVGLLVFLHVGLSMGLRAADNHNIDLEKHIKRTSEYFKKKYDWFSKNQYLQFTSLCKRGVKGIAIWGVHKVYRVGLFGIALKVYRSLQLNVKF